MRLLVVCVCWMVVGCGGKHGGTEVASLDGNADPLDVQVARPNLVFRMDDPNEDLASEKVQAMGPHDRLVSIPLAGGVAQDLGRMPMGDFRVGKTGIALVAKDEVRILDGGTAKRLGTVPGTGSSPIWVDDGIVVLTDGTGQGGDCCDLIRVSTKDGSTSSIAKLKLKGIGRGLVAVDGTDSFIAEATTGETFKIDHAGTVTPLGSPGGTTYTCLAVTEAEIWWGHQQDGHTLILAMPRAGGAKSTVVDIAEKGSYCAASRSELFYADGNHIKAVAAGDKPRNVVDTAAPPRTLAIDGDKLYWAEDAGKKWSIRTAPIR